MAISSELIGKLGGSEVRQIEVPRVSLGGQGEKKVLFSDVVPEGEKWLVIFEGTSSDSSSISAYSSKIRIGEYEPHAIGDFGLSGVVTGSFDVAILSFSLSTYNYEGTIYIIEI